MATLYRKYRPQTFEEVVGQNHIKLTLEYELKSGRLAHSYLFCGPRAVGKTTLARVFAKSLNCLSRTADSAEPCNTCQSCMDITIGRSLDIMEIDAASHTGVDNVRENIIANARLTPSSLKYKIFIIDEVHMLSGAAFNALLKIMEEPPSYIVFILCTTEVHKIPATIISRCQRFDFKKISINDVIRKLSYIARQEKIDVDRSILEAVARFSGGHMRDAESTLGQIMSVGESNVITQAAAELVIPRNNLIEVLNLFELLAIKDSAGAIYLVNKLLDDGFDLKIFCADLIEVLRQSLLVKINPELIAGISVELGEDLSARLSSVTRQLSLAQILKYLERFIKAQAEIKDNLIIQLPLEMAIAELGLELSAPKIATSPSPDNSAAPSAVPATVEVEVKKEPILVGDLSLELIKERWNEFLLAIKQLNHSLSFVLKVCQPTAVSGNELHLTFRHKLHKDRISDMEIKRTVETALQSIYGHELFIKAIHDESLVLPDLIDNVDRIATLSNNTESVPLSPEDQEINKLLKNFGGQVSA